MKVYLTKDSDGHINMWALRPRYDEKLFGGWTWTGCSVQPIWSMVPWQVLWEMGIDSRKLENNCHEIELNIVANNSISNKEPKDK